MKSTRELCRRQCSAQAFFRPVPGAGHALTSGGTHMRGIFNDQALDAMAAWAVEVVRPSR